MAVVLSLRSLTRTRVTVTEEADCHRVRVSGQLTFLAVPRLTRAFAEVPEGASVVVELDGSFMDHAAYEALSAWRARHRSRGGSTVLGAGTGRTVVEPVSAHVCRPWTPWRNHHCTRPSTTPTTAESTTPTGGPATAPAAGPAITPASTPASTPATRRQLRGGVSAFQRHTAPLVREELARLAREGQRPGQLFLTCADSRLVTSMITSSGPGDLFTVRNVGNMMPPPGSDASCDSVAAAVEYAVDILQVSSITVCGHSGCGAMQALLGSGHEAGAKTPLTRWLRHGRPSLARLARPLRGCPPPSPTAPSPTTWNASPWSTS